MSESVLKSILEESAQLEWAKYGSAPEHTFSRKHCRSMKRIFKLYENKRPSYVNSNPSQRIRITRKAALVLALIVFLAAIAGCAAAYFWSQSFRGTVHHDNTELFAINTDNCPSTIEEKYYLSDLSQDFKVLDTDSTSFDEYISYQNSLTGQTITFSQYVKTEDYSFHLNTEDHYLEEVYINGCYGLFIDFSSGGVVCSEVMWDNGDYILELWGNMTKNELIDLAKSAKVFEN